VDIRIENDKKEHQAYLGIAPWVDRVWVLITSRWAWLLGVCWLLVMVMAALVPQEGGGWTAYGSRVGRWLARTQGGASSLGAGVAALGLATIWHTWTVRALQGLTVAWLLLRGLGDLCRWPVARERAHREVELESDWPATQDRARRLAGGDGWRLTSADGELAVLQRVRPSFAWARALTVLVWLGLLCLVCAIWSASLVTVGGVQVPLAVGDQARIGRWGVQQVRLDRLVLQTGADGTVRSLTGELSAISLLGEEQSIRLANGHATALDGALLRVVAVGPVARLSVATLDGDAVTLAPMAGGTAGPHVRLQLGGLSQEHLVAVDDGRAAMRLLEGALAEGDDWALLVELLDGQTGELVARHEVHPPDQILAGDWLIDLAPEYFLRLYVGPRARLLTLLTRWAWIAGAVLVGVGLLARRRWGPESAVVVLGPGGHGSRCELIASPRGVEQLLAEVCGDEDHAAA